MQSVRNSSLIALAKARVWESEGWKVLIADPEGREHDIAQLDELTAFKPGKMTALSAILPADEPLSAQRPASQSRVEEEAATEEEAAFHLEEVHGPWLAEPHGPWLAESYDSESYDSSSRESLSLHSS